MKEMMRYHCHPLSQNASFLPVLLTFLLQLSRVGVIDQEQAKLGNSKKYQKSFAACSDYCFKFSWP